ncbi:MULTISPECIES: transposase [Acidovorax]|uniref:transposase n=2 Tax=Burkholderiales TaxID=80840 RepID=UPI0009EC457F|nr:transposase [Thauera sp.]
MRFQSPPLPMAGGALSCETGAAWRLGLAALMLAALGLIDIHSLSSEDGHPDPRPGGWVQAQLRAGRQGLRQPGIDTGHRAARGAGRDPASQLRAAARPYDKARYRLRSRIERCFAKLKQWRRVATRYDRKPANFMAAVLAASIWLWLQ